MDYPKSVPPQVQTKQPGTETLMDPKPISDNKTYKASGKLKGKVALITGGDSGIGKAIAVTFAKEGADVAIAYLDEHQDGAATKQTIEENGCSCMLFSGDIGDESICKKLVDEVIGKYKHLDIIINNAAEQHPQNSIEDISQDQLERTFKTNIFSFFYITKAALPHLKEGSSIINTSSITAFNGNEALIDYSSTKGAITSFTRSMALNLSNRKIRVNAVAPGPVWTPLISSTFSMEDVANFGTNTPIGRPAQPVELAGAYVFLASDEASYITGETIHVNGGKYVGG